MATVDDLKSPCLPNWCPGCGDFGIWASIKNAIIELGFGPTDFVMVYGIGCHGHMINFLNSYAIETLHGRPIPVAQGIKLANHKLPVIVITGDGDTFGEGTNHLIHAARRNIDITVILHDNQVYGLTTGQTAPTAKKGFKTKSTPSGVIEEPVNPLAITLSGGATFVARGFSGNIPNLTKMIVEGIKHKGFSFIDIFQPCVTFNHINSYQWYREHIYELPSSHDIKNRVEAYQKSLEMADQIPVGVFYKEEKPTYEEQTPQLQKNTLLFSPLPSKEEIDKMIDEFV